MLETIKITNLALIDKCIVNFTEGFNVLTGETGAGKSIIVDALLFLSGLRADKTLIKSGEEFARVEGVFSVDINNNDLNKILSTVNVENEGTLIISRYFSINGKNECRINGELVTLNIIRKISNQIIDIFGQNDSMILIDSENHLKIIDSIFQDKLYDLKQKLKTKLLELNDVNIQINNLGGLDKNREDNIQLLKFQIDEISNANLKTDEEEQLKNKIKIMENSEKIYTALEQVVNALDGDFSLVDIVKSAINSLNIALQYDETLNSDKDRLYSIKYDIEDILSNINSHKSDISYSEAELDSLNDRLSDIKDLERKYGNTIEDILLKKQELDKRLDLLLNSEEELQRLTLSKKHILKEIYEVCVELRNIRKSEISKFRTKLIEELKKLGMKNANFEVSFLNELKLENIENSVNYDGADKIEFLFSANLGIEPRPLSKIISGGEMSRFMLAFKSLQNTQNNKTYIFDEIDTGIGGEIGNVVGQKICDISKINQVICITHLAQIASYGDSNYKIQKFEENNKTITTVHNLNSDEKIIEIARMLGNSSNEITINHAKDIIANSVQYKKQI